MSFDRQIDQVCEHLVVEELLTLGSNGFSVRPKKPIASAASVRVRLNGQLECPSQGVYEPARAYGLRVGPFTVRKSVNDTVILDVVGFARQTFTIPAVSHMDAGLFATLLNKQVRGGTFAAVNDRIEFRTNLTGADATAIFRTGSTLITSVLGMKTERQFKGRQVVPGWTLVNDPLSLPDRPTRLIVFDDVIRTFSPVVEIDYTVITEECRRCAGLGVEHDWRYAKDGDLVEVRDEALLIQELEKMTFTIRGSNPFHAWYGTTVEQQVGSKISSMGLVQGVILTDLTSAFKNWQSAKKAQEEKVGQYVSDAEFPYQLLGVDVQPSNVDPTVVFVTLSVMNRTIGRPIDISRGLKMPSSLLGSAGNGTIRQSLSNFTLTG